MAKLVPSGQTSVVVNGKEVPHYLAMTLLLGMSHSDRPNAISMSDAQQLKQFGLVIVDGVGATIGFIGTQQEHEQRLSLAAESAWKRPR